MRWNELSMKDRADIMKLFIDRGIYDLDTIKGEYNRFAEGGGIHIDPSKRGTFTAAASRHNMGVQEFASKVLANKDDYSAAMVKKANFARNASKWHAYGGNLFEIGGPLVDAANIFDGDTEPTQQMQQGYIRQRPEGTYFYDVEGQPEIDVTPLNTSLSSNPADWSFTDASGKIYSPHRDAVQGTEELREGSKEGPILSAVNNYLRELNWRAKNDPASIALQGKYTMPAIAVTGLLPWLGEAAAATNVAGVPLMTWADAGLTAGFGAHGLNHWLNEGIDGWGDAAMTALEVAPLGRLVKPIYEGVVQPGMRLFNSPLTGNWTKIGNREYRLSPNSFGANGIPLESRTTVPQITAENVAENGMRFSADNINVEHSLDNISRFEGSSPIPTGHQGMVGYRPKQKIAVWDSAKQDMVPLKSIDEVPNLRETINSILRRIKTEDIRPEFLDENAYVNAFRDNATRQGININDLSHEDVAKILTEQYNQLKEGSSGILKDNVLWRTWGRTIPPNEFNWQEHLGEFTQNKGFWGEGNYFGTGVYGSDIVNQPYMINNITDVGYDDLIGATTKAGDAIREGKDVGSQLATRWMSEAPNTRIVAATENGARNRYGWLDTGDPGIEIVTQKNTGIKALNPDLTIGNGETFPRDWSNPNVFKGLLLPFGIGLTGYGILGRDR